MRGSQASLLCHAVMVVRSSLCKLAKRNGRGQGLNSARKKATDKRSVCRHRGAGKAGSGQGKLGGARKDKPAAVGTKRAAGGGSKAGAARKPRTKH